MNKLSPEEREEIPLSAGEVAILMGVDTRTVSRWAIDGLLPCFFTPGGHRRFRRSDIQPFLTPKEHTP